MPSVALPEGVTVAIIGGICMVLGYIVKALAERRSLNRNAAAAETNANAEAAGATAVVVAAARELVEPLRRELAQERADHAGEVEQERAKAVRLREDLDGALVDARRLRVALDEMRQEFQVMEDQYRRRIAELEAALAEKSGP